MQVNKINSSSFAGSLVLPTESKDLPIRLDKNSIVKISAVNGNEKTIIEEKRSGYYNLTIVPIPIDKVMSAYTTSILTPDNVEINLTNLYV